MVDFNPDRVTGSLRIIFLDPDASFFDTSEWHKEKKNQPQSHRRQRSFRARQSTGNGTKGNIGPPIATAWRLRVCSALYWLVLSLQAGLPSARRKDVAATTRRFIRASHLRVSLFSTVRSLSIFPLTFEVKSDSWFGDCHLSW
jgi:hypothetical protein